MQVFTSGRVEQVCMDDILYLKAIGKDVDVYTVKGKDALDLETMQRYLKSFSVQPLP